MSEYEERTEPIKSTSVAADELATPSNLAMAGKVDLVKNTYLVPSEMLPDQFKPLAYNVTAEKVIYKKMRFRVALNETVLSLLRAINGREQNNLIRIDQVQHGVPVQVETPPEKPSFLDRWMDADKVRDYERWKERKELGLE